MVEGTVAGGLSCDAWLGTVESSVEGVRAACVQADSINATTSRKENSLRIISTYFLEIFEVLTKIFRHACGKVGEYTVFGVIVCSFHIANLLRSGVSYAQGTAA
jgi:hypothetical protein